MGARAPVIDRLRCGGFKCDFCGRSLLTLEKLRSHERTLHAFALKNREKAKVSRARHSQNLQKFLTGKPKPVKVVASKIKVIKMPSEKTAKLPEKRRTTKVKTARKTVNPETKEVQMTGRKVEFKCPKCDEKNFSVFFSASKHIQKYHCENKQGKTVDPTSKDLIKPIRVEVCLQCHCNVTSEPHLCKDSPDEEEVIVLYKCIGCNRTFPSIKLFDIHVSGMHSDSVESMFFPNEEEFTNWKQEMEENTETTYNYHSTKYSAKQMFRCANSPITEDGDKTTAHFCPSTIVYQEYPKGIQVHFYTQHSGHNHKKYHLSDKYKTFSITGLLQQAASYTDMTDVKYEENDLYLQFKTLMESIVLDAAKINIDTLKILIGKALDMTSVLTNYDEEGEYEATDNRATLSLSSNKEVDDDITKALEILNTNQKRSTDTVMDVGPAKRLRNKPPVEEKSPILQKVLKPAKNPSTFSMVSEKDSEIILKELANKVDLQNGNKPDPPLKVDVKNFDQSPSSFNDSYKHFVEKNLKGDNKKTTTPKSKSTPQLKKVSLQETKKNTPQDKKAVQEKKSTPQRKNVVKTKMGQFKPNTPPKPKNVPSIKPRLKEVRNTSISGKVKDVVYEVKERENDCNILILKI